MEKVNRDPEGHRKRKKNKAMTQKAPSCADGGRGMGQKPRERDVVRETWRQELEAEAC